MPGQPNQLGDEEAQVVPGVGLHLRVQLDSRDLLPDVGLQLAHLGEQFRPADLLLAVLPLARLILLPVIRGQGSESSFHLQLLF
jgi:hypothetical protein